MKLRYALSLVAILCGAVGAILAAQRRPADWPQWRGLNRDGAAVSFTEPKSWPDELTRKWKVEVGLGYATPIVVDERVYTYSRRDDNETLMALEADSGKLIWQTGYPAPFSMNPAAARHEKGPKSTPAFAAGRLYTLGMSGIVTAFEAATGRLVWQKPASPVGPLYGTSMSPLVDRGLVIVHVGGHNQGALTAFDANTGQVRWSWTGDGPAYGSPMAADFDGVRQVIVFTQENLVGVSAATGALLWKRPFTTPSTQNTITPIFYGRTVIVSGLGKPITSFTVAKLNNGWTTKDVWQNTDVSLYMSNAVVAGDAVYGMSQRNSGQFFCLDAKTGKTLWTSLPRQATNTAIVRAGETLFLLKEDAELIVAKASPRGFEPLKRYTVADSATWAQPAISGNRLFVKDVSGLTMWVW